MHFIFTVIKTTIPFFPLCLYIFLWNVHFCILWYLLYATGLILGDLRWNFLRILSGQVGKGLPSPIYQKVLILSLSTDQFENDKEEFLLEVRMLRHQCSKGPHLWYKLLCPSFLGKYNLKFHKKSFSCHHHNRKTNQNQLFLHNPKIYLIFTLLSTIFSGFKSRWAILFRCRYSTPSSTWAIILLASISSIFLQGMIVPS